MRSIPGCRFSYRGTESGLDQETGVGAPHIAATHHLHFGTTYVLPFHSTRPPLTRLRVKM